MALPAEAGFAAGATGRRVPPSSSSSTPSAKVAPLATAVLGLTAAAERLAAGRDAEPSGSDESSEDAAAAERAARLDRAWCG